MSNSHEVKRLNLNCPYCSGRLNVETEYQGSAYMQEKEVIGFSCLECDAEWDVEGDNTEPPKWVRWPGLYNAPESENESADESE
jgi:hypothetical protein